MTEEIKADSLVYGIIEGEDEGKKKFALKFIMELEEGEKKIVCWITDLLSVVTLQKMAEDYIRLVKGKEEEDIETMLPKLADGVNMVLKALRKGEAEGKRYEQVVVDLCREINLTKEQTQKVLCLMIASVKLVEELYEKRGESMDYIY